MAECPAKHAVRGWWDCPVARELRFKLTDAIRELERMPLFTEPVEVERAQAAYDAHMTGGHDDGEGDDPLTK